MSKELIHEIYRENTTINISSTKQLVYDLYNILTKEQKVKIIAYIVKITWNTLVSLNIIKFIPLNNTKVSIIMRGYYHIKNKIVDIFYNFYYDLTKFLDSNRLINKDITSSISNKFDNYQSYTENILDELNYEDKKKVYIDLIQNMHQIGTIIFSSNFINILKKYFIKIKNSSFVNQEQNTTVSTNIYTNMSIILFPKNIYDNILSLFNVNIDEWFMFFESVLLTCNYTGKYNLYFEITTSVIDSLIKKNIGVPNYLINNSTTLYYSNRKIIDDDMCKQALLYFAYYAEAVYLDDLTFVPKMLSNVPNINDNNFVIKRKYTHYNTLKDLKHFLVYDNLLDSYCIVVRGSHDITDFVLDVIVNPIKKTLLSQETVVHYGMYKSAENILNFYNSKKNTDDTTINDIIKSGKNIYCVGHSLGGGVASFLAILIRDTTQYTKCYALCYGNPSIVSPDFGQNCENFIISIVNKYDMVPRLSITNLCKFVYDTKQLIDSNKQKNSSTCLNIVKGQCTYDECVENIVTFKDDLVNKFKNFYSTYPDRNVFTDNIKYLYKIYCTIFNKKCTNHDYFILDEYFFSVINSKILKIFIIFVKKKSDSKKYKLIYDDIYKDYEKFTFGDLNFEPEDNEDYILYNLTFIKKMYNQYSKINKESTNVCDNYIDSIVCKNTSDDIFTKIKINDISYDNHEYLDKMKNNILFSILNDTRNIKCTDINITGDNALVFVNTIIKYLNNKDLLYDFYYSILVCISQHANSQEKQTLQNIINILTERFIDPSFILENSLVEKIVEFIQKYYTKCINTIRLNNTCKYTIFNNIFDYLFNYGFSSDCVNILILVTEKFSDKIVLLLNEIVQKYDFDNIITYDADNFYFSSNNIKQTVTNIIKEKNVTPKKLQTCLELISKNYDIFDKMVDDIRTQTINIKKNISKNTKNITIDLVPPGKIVHISNTDTNVKNLQIFSNFSFKKLENQDLNEIVLNYNMLHDHFMHNYITNIKHICIEKKSSDTSNIKNINSIFE